MSKKNILWIVTKPISKNDFAKSGYWKSKIQTMKEKIRKGNKRTILDDICHSNISRGKNREYVLSFSTSSFSSEISKNWNYVWEIYFFWVSMFFKNFLFRVTNIDLSLQIQFSPTLHNNHFIYSNLTKESTVYVNGVLCMQFITILMFCLVFIAYSKIHISNGLNVR